MNNKKEEISIKYLPDFIKEITRLTPSGNEILFFRGQGDHTWGVTPHIFREDRYKMDEAFYMRDIINSFPNKFHNKHSTFDKFVEMQHFGIPTRLLDITRNPLVALYFCVNTEKNKTGRVIIYKAKDKLLNNNNTLDWESNNFTIDIKNNDSDTVSLLSSISFLSYNDMKGIKRSAISHINKINKIVSSFRKDETTRENAFVALNKIKNDFNEKIETKKLADIVRNEKNYFENKINPLHLVSPILVKPKLTNDRIISQQGAFILYGLDESNKYIKEHAEVIIHSRDKDTLQKDLEKYGISTKTLFPDLEGYGRYMKSF